MHISELVDAADEDWGTPSKNRMSLVRYGVPQFDAALDGIDIVSGEVVAIQGSKKNRKTTTALNFLVNIMQSLTLQGLGKLAVWDTLETGETIERIRDKLVAMVATGLMCKEMFGTKREDWPYVKVINWNPPESTPFKLTPGFLKLQDRTPLQQKAIVEAKAIIRTWPLHIYGTSPKKKRRTKTRDLDASLARWRKLAEEGCVIFVSDHILLYNVTGGEDYHRLNVIVPKLADFHLDTGSFVLAIVQEGTTSVKDYRAGLIESPHSRGGTVLAEEANTVIRASYVKAKCAVDLDIIDTRKAPAAVTQYLEPCSGLFIGAPQNKEKGG